MQTRLTFRRMHFPMIESRLTLHGYFAMLITHFIHSPNPLSFNTCPIKYLFVTPAMITTRTC